jgi:hypothetical protein
VRIYPISTSTRPPMSSPSSTTLESLTFSTRITRRCVHPHDSFSQKTDWSQRLLGRRESHRSMAAMSQRRPQKPRVRVPPRISFNHRIEINPPQTHPHIPHPMPPPHNTHPPLRPPPLILPAPRAPLPPPSRLHQKRRPNRLRRGPRAWRK